MTAIRTEAVKLVADVAAGIANHNTLRAKLNADVGVMDIDYAVATSATAVAPAALTVTSVASSGADTMTNTTDLTLTRG